MRVKLERAEKPMFGRWELHHVFCGTGRRKLSEKYNCTVYLTPEQHRDSKRGVHFDADYMRKLEAEYQTKLEAAGWTREEFIETFGRSYL